MAIQSRAEKREQKRIDALIDNAYTETCAGIQIDIMDICKVFAEGRKALAEGRDLKTAIRAFVETIRCDGEDEAMTMTVVRA